MADLICPHCGKIAAHMFEITVQKIPVEDDPSSITQAADQLAEAARRCLDNLPADVLRTTP